jgi:hypothetical protein
LAFIVPKGGDRFLFLGVEHHVNTSYIQIEEALPIAGPLGTLHTLVTRDLAGKRLPKVVEKIASN